MIKLREWQRECVEHALKTFEHQPHFLCHATPGAGKTVMVASLAKALLERNRIDFVLCFSPSRAVAQSVASTFTKILGRSFNGQIGAAGGSYTYQSMNTLPAELWRVLSENRVFVVLDEIHHCSGSTWGEHSIGNSWGKTILAKIKGRAIYSMALSGTPWRTDDSPIVLSRYTMPGGKLWCDYEYGIQRAVREGVCRPPNVVLIDNREISLKSSELGLKTYSSIGDTLKHGHITYPDFLFRDEVIDHTLSEASKKLLDLRKEIPSAAGLVVAASVAHAQQISSRLSLLGETPVIVTYQTPDAQRVISDFKTSSDRWIISVGMISEGTDIPRLQVCCHLSRIRTELHFRQVLGRILRRQTTDPQKLGGWLYVLAEPNLTEYSRSLGDDLPEHHVVTFSPKSTSSHPNMPGTSEVLLTHRNTDPWEFGAETTGHWSVRADQVKEKENLSLSVSNHYWSEILSLFGDCMS